MDTSNKSLRIGIDVGGIIAMLAVALTIYGWQVRPHLREAEARMNRGVEVQRLAQQGQDLRRSLKQTTDRAVELRTVVAQTNIELQPRSSLNYKLAKISGLAVDNNLQLDLVDPGEGRISGRFDIVPIRLTGNGNFSNCARFLGKIHEEMADLTVIKLKIDGQPGRDTNLATFEFGFAWHATPMELRGG